MIPAVLIPLPSGMYTLIDEADLERVLPWRWNSYRAGPHWQRLNHYVAAYVGGRTRGLHNYLLSPPLGLVSDHVNGDGLDNRRSANLRAVTHKENARNQHRGPAPLSLGILPEGVPILDLSQALYLRAAQAQGLPLSAGDFIAEPY